MEEQPVIKPGRWWIVRFRRVKSLEQITGYLTCRNAYHAGHSGFERKSRYVPGQRHRRYVPRSWDLKDHSHLRLGYKFAEISDLKAAIRAKPVKEWMAKNEGILEIVEVEGWLPHGAITAEKVIERRFPPGANEMEILAMEYAMGE